MTRPLCVESSAGLRAGRLRVSMRDSGPCNAGVVRRERGTDGADATLRRGQVARDARKREGDYGRRARPSASRTMVSAMLSRPLLHVRCAIATLVSAMTL